MLLITNKAWKISQALFAIIIFLFAFAVTYGDQYFDVQNNKAP